MQPARIAHPSFLAAVLVPILLGAEVAAQHGESVQTDRSSSRWLPLPKGPMRRLPKMPLLLTSTAMVIST